MTKFYIDATKIEFDHGYYTSTAVERMARAAIVASDPDAEIVLRSHPLGRTIAGEDETAVAAANYRFDRLCTDGGEGWIAATDE